MVLGYTPTGDSGGGTGGSVPVASSRLASPASPSVAVGAGLSWRHAVGRHARLGKVAACRGAWNAWPVVAICATTSAATRKGARRRAAAMLPMRLQHV